MTQTALKHCHGLARLLFLISAITWVLSDYRHANGDVLFSKQGFSTTTIQERLRSQVDLSLAFVDHLGRRITLRQLFSKQIPVLMTINVFECPMLCTVQLNELIQSLKTLPWKPGTDFRIVTLSMDPKESHHLAREKRSSYVNALGMGSNVDWTFLVGSAENIRSLATGLGFRFVHDSQTNRFLHPSVLFFFSATGHMMYFLQGTHVRPRDIRLAFVESSQGQLGSLLDMVMLGCFRFDPAQGNYTTFSLGILGFSVGGLVLLIYGFLAIKWLRKNLRPKPSLMTPNATRSSIKH